jgi:hypothetical protein
MDRGAALKKIAVCLLAAGAIGAAFAPRAAAAGDADIAAGLIGGLALGTLFGAAVSAPPPVPPPPVVYAAPAPVYMAPRCYWTRGQPVWDGYRWYRPRIQVCD